MSCRGKTKRCRAKRPGLDEEDQHGYLGEALSPAAVRDIVKKRCALAGIEGDFSAHSLRSGFVTEAGRQNVPLAETMAMTGHHSVATVMGYFRAEGNLSNAAGRLLEE